MEHEHLCTACGGRGYSGWSDNHARVWVEQADCEHCDGSGQEPCPPNGDLERALRRAEFRAHDGHGRERRAARERLASQLVADWQLDADRAVSIAAVVSADGSVLRLNWLACVLPLPTHAERVRAAEMLLASCGYR